MSKTTPIVPEDSDHDSHRGMRYGVLDLIRATEQTAVLMAGAEGRGIDRDDIARCATLSMAGFLSRSMYEPHIPIHDEIYERYGSEGLPTTDPARIWAAIESKTPDREGSDRRDLALDFNFAPIDGKRALSEGQNGGTASSLCFAPHAPAGNSVFAPPRDRDQSQRGPGAPSEADRSPPWLVLTGSSQFVERFGGRDLLQEFVQKVASACVNQPVERLVYELFEHAASESSPTTKFPIRIERALATLVEPRYMAGWNRQVVPEGKKRMFVGSSVAVALAVMFPRKGFDCAVAVTRHAHAIQMSVAARVLGGVVIAIPLRSEKLKNVREGRVVTTVSKKEAKKDLATLVVESDDIWSQNRFVRSGNAALIVSGISDNVVLEPVRFGDNSAQVHTLCLSARTKSVRVLEHRLTLDGPAATRFASFDGSALPHLMAYGQLPPAEWNHAGVWKRRFDEMFNASAR